VFTLFITCGISALLFALGTHTPSRPDQETLLAYQTAMIRHSNTTLNGLNGSNELWPNSSAILAENVTTLANATFKLANSSKWLDSDAVVKNFRCVCRGC
jgi:hypothetical protein